MEEITNETCGALAPCGWGCGVLVRTVNPAGRYGDTIAVEVD